MIRRFLVRIGLLSPGTVPGTEPPPIPMPASALPSTAVLARLDVSLPVDRSMVGTIRGRDARGSVVMEPAPVFGASDPGFAARMGNPSQDPERLFGHVPTGTYLATKRLLPEAPSEFGPHGVLVLVPSLGQAARADARGRTSLLLHGGSTKAAVMGALRVPEATMTRVVMMLPSDLASGNFEVVVDEVEQAEEEHFEDSWGDDEFGHAWWGWEEGERRDDDGYLQQMVLWHLLTDEEADRAAAVQEGVPPNTSTLFSGVDPVASSPLEPTLLIPQVNKPAIHEPEPSASTPSTSPASTNIGSVVGDGVADWSPSGSAYDR